MPNREAIERGYEFEDRIAHILSTTKQPGSGNKFYAQGDCVGNGLLISAKSEINLTWAKIHRHLQDAIDMAFQTGDIPVLAIEIAETEDQMVIMTLNDFSKALIEVKIPETFESKGLEKRSTAEVPTLLR